MAIDYDDPTVIQDAKDKLAEMYSRANRQQRIAIGRGLGYDKARRNPDSARRSAERLATFRVGKGSKLDVTRYFKDLVTQDDPVAWTGELPFITLERGEFYYLVGYVGFLQESFAGGTTSLNAFDGFITPTLKRKGNPKGHAKGINQVRELFEEFNDVVERIFDGTFQDEGDSRLSNDYAGIVAIGISREGVDEIEERAGRITKTRPDVYGVTLISSAVRFTKTKRKKDRKAIARSRASSREFPVRRRKEIIQYIRRSYAQRSRFYE